MAQRRMFSLKIIDTDDFLDMPVSARELYFQLSMRADDDGFIGNPKRIIKMIGASDDDVKVLFTKQFIIPFESGVCVVKDWKVHNYIQKDRYQETRYLEEKSKLDEENGQYKLSKCIQNVSKKDTQDRIGKDSIGKDSIEIEPPAHRTIQYLINIPKEDQEEFTGKFNCNEKQIISKGEDLLNYCKAKGRQYKDYKAFLRNALKQDYGDRADIKSNKYKEIS